MVVRERKVCVGDTIAVPNWRWTAPVRRVLVQGPSMVPALRDGDQVCVWTPPFPRPRPGDVVVVELPGGRGVGVKRLRMITADGSLWLEGDNPFGSTDSRQFGALPRSALRGRVVVRLWPRPGWVHAGVTPEGPGPI